MASPVFPSHVTYDNYCLLHSYITRVLISCSDALCTRLSVLHLFITLLHYSQVGEYRELTEKLVPAKLWREWTSLFVSGKPLYDTQQDTEATTTQQRAGPTPADILEMERQAILNEGDFQEYKVC